MALSTSANPKDLLKKELYSRYALTPSDEWLSTFLSAINRPPPLPALTSTAHFRLTSTDFTVSLVARQPYIFPASIGDVQVKSVTLQADTPVQVLDIVDTSSSKYSQIEAIERVERGEEVRGREVIRSVPVAEDEGGADDGRARGTGSKSTAGVGGSKGTAGPHKLLLQDAASTKVWAFELSHIDKITIVNTNTNGPGPAVPAQTEGMQIGCKLLLKSGTSVRRGMVMLTPTTTTVMGGKVEAWDKKWRDGRKARLQQDLAMEKRT